jgi:hypothetical protein
MDPLIKRPATLTFSQKIAEMMVATVGAPYRTDALGPAKRGTEGLFSKTAKEK